MVTPHAEVEHVDIGQGGNGNNGDQQAEKVSQLPQYLEWKTAATMLVETIRTFWNICASIHLSVHAEEDNDGEDKRLNAVPDCKHSGYYHIIRGEFLLSGNIIFIPAVT